MRLMLPLKLFSPLWIPTINCAIKVAQFRTLEVLQEHGIAANDIQKLQTAGYHTVQSVSDLQIQSAPSCANRFILAKETW